jgi:hypothetical protein
MGYGDSGMGSPMDDMKVGDCPKCNSRTFVLTPKAGFGRHFKGRCYKCGHEQVI